MCISSSHLGKNTSELYTRYLIPSLSNLTRYETDEYRFISNP